MIKTLQKRFVLAAMTAISVLLLVLLSAVNIGSYLLSQQQSDRILQMLVENEERFKPREFMGGMMWHEFLNRPIDEDEAMAARYFLMHWDGNDMLVYVDVNHISSVTEAEAIEYGEKAAFSGKLAGRADRFQYRCTETIDGGKTIVFLDTFAQRWSVFSIWILSAAIGAVCWLLMLLLVILLSRKAIRPIAQNMEKQRQFVTDAGHEIKTPLAIIVANTEALELHQGQSKWSKNIRAQTMRLNGLMQNLLTLARMDEADVKIAVEDVDLSALLQETVDTFQESADLRNVSIKKEIQNGVVLRANQEHINQLLSILMDNAVKYTNESGEIFVELKKTEKNICLQMENTCDELPQVEPEKLFDRFCRGDRARTQKSGGYGIGLSVAQAVVQSCGGSISADYRGKNKIVFTVEF